MTTLRINRAYWHRGQGFEGSALYIPSTGKMCCLGFYCLQNGFSQEDMANIGMPSGLRDSDGHYLESSGHPTIGWLFDYTNNTGRLVGKEKQFWFSAVNDDHNTPEDVREARIRELFAQEGISVEFFDEEQALA